MDAIAKYLDNSTANQSSTFILMQYALLYIVFKALLYHQLPLPFRSEDDMALEVTDSKVIDVMSAVT